MKVFSILLLAGLGAGATAQTLFYGGDADGRGALLSEWYGQAIGEISVFDDFVLTGGTSTVTGVFGNFLIGAQSSSRIHWEIRSGMSAGNGGTVVHAGTISDATVSTTGRVIHDITEYHYESAVTPFDLAPGTYYLSVAVYGNINANTYVSYTGGANGVGGPLANDNSFFDGYNPFAPGGAGHYAIYEPASIHAAMVTPSDFSMGLRGVPEPASVVTLGFGLIALARKRKRS